MASNFKYNENDFADIYANFSYDLNYNKTIPDYLTGNTLKTYNQTNGSTTQQTNIPYTYGVSGTNYSNNVQAYYIEYTNSGTFTLSIPNYCNKLRVFLCGAGGSGGAGGGDTGDKSGTNGAGGGGGAYGYQEIDLTSIIELVNVKVTIGTGGASVSGGNPASGDSNNGMPGNPGGDTTLIAQEFNRPEQVLVRAKGGGGGDGGHPTSSASPGIGGTTVSGGIVIQTGNNSSGTNGGQSGYGKFETANNFTTYFKPYTSGLTYGNGGNGTNGGRNPNTNPTGAGNNGYARIYFIV